MKHEIEYGELTLICDGTSQDWELCLYTASMFEAAVELDKPPYEWPKEYIKLTPYALLTDEDIAASLAWAEREAQFFASGIRSTGDAT